MKYLVMAISNKDILETFEKGEIVEVGGQIIDPKLLVKYKSREYSGRK